MSDPTDPAVAAGRGLERDTRWLDAIERIGNRLPAPATLFLIGAALVMLLSQVAASLDWTVEKTISQEVTQPLLDASGQPLLDAAGTFTSQSYMWSDKMREGGLKEALAWRDGPYQDYSAAPRD